MQDGITGFTVPVDEPEALAERLTRLINDTTLKIEMGMNAAELAKSYSWEKIARRLLLLYADVIGGQSTFSG